MNKLAIFCDKLIKVCLYFLTFTLPLFFLPFGSEVIEFNKQFLLLIVTIIATIAWLGKMAAQRKIALRKSFLNFLVILFLAIYGLATIFSIDKITSVFGALGVEKDAFITVLAFVLLYFVIINNLRELKIIKRLLCFLFLSTSIAALFVLLQFLDILPKALKFVSLNTIGTLSGLGVFLAFSFAIISAFLLESKEAVEGKWTKLEKILLLILALFILFLLISIDTWMIWTALIVGLAFVLAFANLRAHEIKNLLWLALPMAGLVIAVLLFFVRTPVNFNLPAEVAPSIRTSAGVAQKVLVEKPFFGSGPSTFIFDYAKYKPKEVNLTPFWNLNFDRSSSRILTMLATIGLLGVCSWLFLSIFLIVKIFIGLLREKTSELWFLLLGFGAAWFLLFAAKFFYSSNLTLEFLFWFSAAILVILTSHDFWEVSLEKSPRAALGLSFLLTVVLIFSISSFYLLGQRYAADLKFAQAVRASASGEEVDKVIDYLNQAIALNKYNDTYFRNLAQSLLAKINQELRQAPSGEKALELQNKIAAAVEVGKRATEIGPKNSANWATLASVYGTIFPLGIEGADEWAVKSYSTAIELEPNNPFLVTELGKIYLGIADFEAQRAGVLKEEEKAQAEKKAEENLKKAEEQFRKAIELKIDYMPAHYQLALVLARQGKQDEAISKLEDLKIGAPNDIGVAFQLGMLYYQKKELDKAVDEFKRALELAPNFADARWFLAKIYEEQGKKDLAISELEEILKLNPENEQVKKKIEELKAPPAPPAPEEPTPQK